MKTLRRYLKRKRFVAAVLLASLLSVSCEEVIELDISEVEKQLVIEGTISTSSSASAVRLSFAESAFKKSRPRGTTSAVVTLIDNCGNSERLKETEPGVYVPVGILGIPRRTYTLTVELNGRVYAGASTMPEPMNLDSIRCISLCSGPQVPTSVAIDYYLTNKLGTREYCLIKAYQPSDMMVFWTVYSDKYSDGKQVMVDGPAFFSADATIIVELISIDKATYEYFFSLRQLIGEDDLELPDFLGMNEYNPKSNLTNQALGYFSAQAQRTYVLTLR